MYKLLVITTTCASYSCTTKNKQWTGTSAIEPDRAHRTIELKRMR